MTEPEGFNFDDFDNPESTMPDPRGEPEYMVFAMPDLIQAMMEKLEREQYQAMSHLTLVEVAMGLSRKIVTDDDRIRDLEMGVVGLAMGLGEIFEGLLSEDDDTREAFVDRVKANYGMLIDSLYDLAGSDAVLTYGGSVMDIRAHLMRQATEDDDSTEE